MVEGEPRSVLKGSKEFHQCPAVRVVQDHFIAWNDYLYYTTTEEDYIDEARLKHSEVKRIWEENKDKITESIKARQTLPFYKSTMSATITETKPTTSLQAFETNNPRQEANEEYDLSDPNNQGLDGPSGGPSGGPYGYGGGPPGGGGGPFGGQPIQGAQGPNLGYGLKVKPPSKYSGDRGEKAREFIAKCDMYFELGGFNADQTTKIKFALFYCEGEAWSWAIPYVKALKIPGHSLRVHMLSWQGFAQHFLKTWASANDEEKAKHDLYMLKQLGPYSDITSYVAKFNSLATRTNVEEPTLRFWFKEGLSLAGKEFLARVPLDQWPNSLIDFQQYVIQGLEHQSQIRGQMGGPRFDRGGRNNQRRRPFANQPNNSDRPPAPNNNHQKRLSPEKRAELAKDKKCYICEKTGHFARDCPDRNRQRNPSNWRKPANAAFGKEEGESDSDNEESLGVQAVFKGGWLRGVTSSLEEKPRARTFRRQRKDKLVEWHPTIEGKKSYIIPSRSPTPSPIRDPPVRDRPQTPLAWYADENKWEKIRNHGMEGPPKEAWGRQGRKRHRTHGKKRVRFNDYPVTQVNEIKRYIRDSDVSSDSEMELVPAPLPVTFPGNRLFADRWNLQKKLPREFPENLEHETRWYTKRRFNSLYRQHPSRTERLNWEC